MYQQPSVGSLSPSLPINTGDTGGMDRVVEQPTVPKYKTAWSEKDGKLYRFNGYFNMRYDYNNDSKISKPEMFYRIFYTSQYRIDQIDKNIPHTLIFANKNMEDVKIYLCNKDNFIKNIKKQKNKIVAEILDADNEAIYVVFENNLDNVTEINYEPKYSADFKLLKSEIGKIVSEYGKISSNRDLRELFKKYSELEEIMNNIIKSRGSDGESTIDLYKKDMEVRIKICDYVMNINKSLKDKLAYYKKMLITTKDHMNQIDSSIRIETLQKNYENLMENVKQYDIKFIYLE